jgi:hypothetical protein
MAFSCLKFPLAVVFSFLFSLSLFYLAFSASSAYAYCNNVIPFWVFRSDGLSSLISDDMFGYAY